MGFLSNLVAIASCLMRGGRHRDGQAELASFNEYTEGEHAPSNNEGDDGLDSEEHNGPDDGSDDDQVQEPTEDSITLLMNSTSPNVWNPRALDLHNRRQIDFLHWESVEISYHVSADDGGPPKIRVASLNPRPFPWPFIAARWSDDLTGVPTKFAGLLHSEVLFATLEHLFNEPPDQLLLGVPPDKADGWCYFLAVGDASGLSELVLPWDLCL